MRIALWALLLAVAWTVALATVAHSPGLRSTPGIWLGVFGLPGVVITNWAQSFLFHRFNNYLGYSLMFLVNWIFYCSVIQGFVSIFGRLQVADVPLARQSSAASGKLALWRRRVEPAPGKRRLWK